MKKFFWFGLLCALLVLTACNAEKTTQPDVSDTAAAETESDTFVFAEDAQTTSETSPETTAAETQTTRDMTPVRVHVREAKDGDPALLSAAKLTAIDDEPPVQLLFTAEGTPQDFRFLSLELTDIDDEGRLSFRCNSLLEIPADVLKKGAAVTTVFYGDIPNNGFSYADENGQTQYFTIEFSGEDGSLVTAPFTPAES